MNEVVIKRKDIFWISLLHSPYSPNFLTRGASHLWQLKKEDHNKDVMKYVFQTQPQIFYNDGLSTRFARLQIILYQRLCQKLRLITFYTKIHI